MVKNFRLIGNLILFMVSAAVLAAGCGGNQTAVPDPPTAPAATPIEPTAAPTVVALPKITAVELDRSEAPRYDSIEMKLAVEADYTNPYDARQVSLDGVFKSPDGKEMKVPGFWDGEAAWRIRFTPSQEGEWNYQLFVRDGRGVSLPAEGKFTVTSSELHGWLQIGNWVNPEYSSRYLVYHDGAPFYGVGHGDAVSILADGLSLEQGIGLFDLMKAAGENYVVWWPLYSNSPVDSAYDQYSVPNMKVIDLVVKDAQKKGVFLIFTIWDHRELRAEGHAWGNPNWEGNGFSKLSDIDSFFTSADSWVWQENFYRYVIARWGYSPAIGMWQTVSEINGTNAYKQTDPWHEKVNAYFAANDPYRHPTTASMSGDVDWPKGFAAMDAPQVHVYALENDAVKAAKIIANWTGTMWTHEAKPNWIGEFGADGNAYYPELFHNSIWAALASGAALTPAEWNDRRTWMQMSPEMYADTKRLAQFVIELPLAELNPAALQISGSDAQVRAWGVAGKEGGLIWAQDFSLEGKPIEEVRKAETLRKGVQLEVEGMTSGTYSVRPYDTWQGAYLDAFDVVCAEGQTCKITLPDFKADLAFKVERKQP